MTAAKKTMVVSTRLEEGTRDQLETLAARAGHAVATELRLAVRRHIAAAVARGELIVVPRSQATKR